MYVQYMGMQNINKQVYILTKFEDSGKAVGYKGLHPAQQILFTYLLTQGYLHVGVEHSQLTAQGPDTASID